MPRQHPDAPPTIACIWPANSTLNDEIAQRLICWAGSENVAVASQPTFHYEVRKDLCTTQGPLQFTDGGPNYCPLGDDLTVTTATGLDPTSCHAEPPPGSTPASQEGNNVFSGNNTYTGTNLFNGTTTLTGDVNISGETTMTDTLEIDAPNAATTDLILRQLNNVTSTDANMLEVYYHTFNTLRLNELGLLRVLTPPASTGLGKEGETTAQFHAGTPTSKALRILDQAGTENAYIRGNGQATFLGAITAPNLLESAWVNITIDSPQTAGKYTAQTNGTGGYNAPQVRIINGGKTAELRGRINSVTTGGVADEIMATTMPTSIALGTGTATAVPPRNRGFMAMGSGGGLRLTISTAGSLQILGSANTQPFMNLDGITYSLEL